MDNKDIANLRDTLANLTSLLQSHLPKPLENNRVMISKLVFECLEAKAKAGLRPRYLQQIKSTFGQFAKIHGAILVTDLTGKIIEDWLNAGTWSARTRRNYLTDVRTLLAFAKRRGYVRENVAEAVEKPVPEPQALGILPLKDIWRVLEEARNLGIGAYIGVMLFAGLRPEEADRLTADNFKEQNIIVSGHKAKTRRRRIIPIQPALRTWLELCGESAWPPVDRHRKLKKLHKSVHEWPHDALRNCFVSYGLPVFGSTMVALWAGHSEFVMFSSYAELVTDTDARQLWGLCSLR